MGTPPTSDYERLKTEIQRLQSLGSIGSWPTDEQRVDWAYSTTKIENDDITREMVEEAVRRRPVAQV